ncbi:hypothetical protein [Flavobacterium sp.]|uniref:hypothetical protein n=1 Tax=Flavobacterium sp. TaxID=239 RepID=UPI0033423723
MNKFHQIPTDSFVPISHDNSYLFNHYDKVANFLAFNLEKNYKNILAKPVQNGYAFDWFSNYDNLKNINELPKSASETELLKYWEFIDVIQHKISQLSDSNDENNTNWAELLSKVFDHQNNFIFSNGTNLSIVWGWKFDNIQNYKPNFAAKIDSIYQIEEPIESQPTPIPQDVLEEEFIDEPVEDEEIQPDNLDEEIKEETSFLEFLKWFASTYWWLLWVLTALIAFVFFIKSFAFEIN